MPSSARHVHQADINDELSRHRLDENEPNDCPWIVTLMFYAALHWVDAYFATLQLPRGIHPASHQSRNEWIARTPALLPIERLYLDLFNQSMDARYELKPFDKARVQALRVTRLDPVRAHVKGLLPP